MLEKSKLFLLGKESTLALSIVASLLVALSGIILFTDKIVPIELSNTFGFKNSQAFIWVLSQTLSPIILIFGVLLKPFRISFFIPIYFYSIQLIWVFESQLTLDDSLLHVYAIGCVFGLTLLLILIYQMVGVQKDRDIARNIFLEKALNLSIEVNKKIKSSYDSDKYRYLAHQIDDVQNGLLNNEYTVEEVKQILIGIYKDFLEYNEVDFEEEEKEQIKILLQKLYNKRK